MRPRLVPRAPRTVGIFVCGALLLIPQVACYLEVSPSVMKAMHLISLLFPLTFYVLANLLIDEGRERAEREGP